MSTFRCLTAALFLAALTALSSASCFSTCAFKFCSGRKYFALKSRPDVAFTGPICSKAGIPIGIVGSTGEAFVAVHGKAVPISHYSPYGLRQHFSPSFFKSFNVGYKSFSGIGHETPQQNQADFLGGRCFAVPLTAYQVLGTDGNVVDNVHPRGNPLRDCVAFVVRSKNYHYHEKYEEKEEEKDERKEEKGKRYVHQTPKPVFINVGPKKPRISKAPYATPTAIITAIPVPSASSGPSASPVFSESPVPSTSPIPSEQPRTSESPLPSETPIASADPFPSPAVSNAPVESQAPVVSGAPIESQAPVESSAPVPSEGPVESQAPFESSAPVPSEGPVQSPAHTYFL